jgi:hypothetical protein
LRVRDEGDFVIVAIDDLETTMGSGSSAMKYKRISKSGAALVDGGPKGRFDIPDAGYTSILVQALP